MKILEELTNLTNDNSYKMLEEYYENKSILDILGVSTKEFAHSNFLSWLLDSNESHKLGSFPLKCFIYACFTAKAIDISSTNTKQSNIEKAKTYIFPENWTTDIFLKNYEINNLEINREYFIGEFGRPDLLFKFTIVSNDSSNIKFEKEIILIIENKIYSAENDKQTLKYYNWFIKEYGNNDKVLPVFVYLTPYKQGNMPIDEHFLPMSYETLSKTVIEKCIANENISLEGKTILISYLRGLGFTEIKDIFSLTNTEIETTLLLWNKYSNILTVFINNYIKDKELQDFYSNNKTFKNMLYILLEHGTTYLNDNNILEEKLRTILNTKYSFEYEGHKYSSGNRKFPLKRLALEVLKKASKELNFKEFMHKFSKICVTAKNKPFVVELKEIQADINLNGWYFDEKEDLLTIDNKTYCLYAWWSSDEVKKLIEIAL